VRAREGEEQAREDGRDVSLAGGRGDKNEENISRREAERQRGKRSARFRFVNDYLLYITTMNEHNPITFFCLLRRGGQGKGEEKGRK
jgi:hypothetical protein